MPTTAQTTATTKGGLQNHTITTAHQDSMIPTTTANEAHQDQGTNINMMITSREVQTDQTQSIQQDMGNL